MPWVSATGSMWPAGWIRWNKMDEFWIVAVLISGIILLAVQQSGRAVPMVW